MEFNFEDLFNNISDNNKNKSAENDPLKIYGRNLTDLAAKHELEPVINRDDEIRRLIRILSRKTKNNPVLVGEPGVGKTAIVEGLARKIVEGEVPENLKNKDVYEIDLASLIAGAQFQGQFEKRLKDVLKRIEDSNGEIIVFIDEIHMLVGTGKNADGGMDAANIVKPLMARGKMHLIGATTYNEYRKYIEKDAALERRMQKVDILEPSIDDTITILRGIKGRFENYHNVKIQDDALVAAAKLSSRYISDRFLPDKAIDLVDEAAATIKTEINYEPEELEKVKQLVTRLNMEKIALNEEDKEKHKNRIRELEDEIKSANQKISKLQNKWNEEKNELEDLSKLKKYLDDLWYKINIYKRETKYEDASRLEYSEVPKIEKKIKELEEKISFSDSTLIKNSVTAEEIAGIVSKWTMIPVTKLLETDKQKLLNLENELRARIKGQDEAVNLVSKAVLRAKANINDPNRPLASFLFTGSTGVGKTELARALAFALFDSEKQMIRLDMSEYMEKHSVSKIIGAPPGYVGFDQGGSLAENIRKNPYTILLFDEIEKADRNVLNILLQILDNGAFTDSTGRVINCRNLIIIMTSNIASNTELNEALDQIPSLKAELLKFLSPEFVNRIDEIVKFNQLQEQDILQIVILELQKLIKRIYDSKEVTLKYSPKLVEYIAKNAYDENFGARPIKRYIQNNIESVLAYQIIDGSIQKNHEYEITVFANKFIVSKVK
ncbi:ATP-dependent Clp protease ATP-binding subunit [Mycoplasmopsis bovis]|uniref:ATP-dependent chaperone protein ClpB n=1 Tax=Mycoplasmopsis bovis (strain ATCC 25523 / DSM 22781 / NCTC 10131 / PG45) TaxID=289397 RepID=A0A454AP99_MYCBG|nr:AAA family ATPase [Mycoplasmopsis bovis]ADR24898.1 ATP-dependent chaperone protein ClpB [Mycoplasmopsis bovis PG45]MBT1323079.1 AAA family ATPase [Mycoplasmopsis bovis]QLI75736.1 AAA family ATPase [Mycoplasmopsis bovis]TKA60769.1 ATP-dependent Clp protease ATP-binding subunit (ClpB) [Mycoplasmopsis bovis 1067]UTW26425.1 AAA family ATPase [Mycoplasmopsis bovis]